MRIMLLAFLAAITLTTSAKRKREPFPGGKCWLYRVSLSDKNGTPYSIKKPSKYLSAKAIERRERQHLAIDSTDLPINPAYIKGISKAGFQIVSKSKWNNTVVVRVQDTTSIAKLKALPYVCSTRRVFTSPDSVAAPSRHVIQTDTTKADPNKYYGRADAQISTLNGKFLHEAGFKGKGMTIAVIDGGFMNLDSLELLSNVNILGTRNFVYPDTKSVYGELDHGTAVLSTMAANLPGRIVGTAPEAAYWLLRSEYGETESESEEDFWAAAAEFADSVGVDVINSSLGYNEFYDKSTSHTYRQLDGHTAQITKAAARLASKGIILTNSAGNDGAKTWKKICFPADADGILTVGAMRPDSINAIFSSVGPTADGRVKPDVMAIGSPCAAITGFGLIFWVSGTSFSSPITCGMVACLWQALPHLTATEIMNLIRRSSDRAAYPDNIYGYGIPDFGKAYLEGKRL